MLFGCDWDVAKEVWQEEGLHQAARQMKAKGLNIALIAEITGLSEAEIEGLD